jgi:hypothetical protein
MDDDDLDTDTPLEVPKCPDCGAEIGAELHRCKPEPPPADEVGELYRETGDPGA